MNVAPVARPRPLYRRFAALLWAVAFLLGTAGEGFGLHPCPHHGNGAAAAPHAGAQDAEHAGHSVDVAAGSHAVHGTSDAAHPESHDPHGGPCTCGSACQASAGAALPSDVPQPFGETAVSRSIPGVVTEGLPAPIRPPHVLPFAQAPPRAR